MLPRHVKDYNDLHLSESNADNLIEQAPLWVAAKYGNRKEVDAAIERKQKEPSFDIDAEDPTTKMSSLYYAVANGHTEIVRRILAAGADVSRQDDNGRSPIHAALDGHIDVCRDACRDIYRELFAAGADVNAQDKYGRTPLHEALEDYNINAVEAILACSPNLDIKDMSNTSPLVKGQELGY
ncbi:MAG: hypothetical protein Q9190_003657 [Brigantiaea leucoxantha]